MKEWGQARGRMESEIARKKEHLNVATNFEKARGWTRSCWKTKNYNPDVATHEEFLQFSSDEDDEAEDYDFAALFKALDENEDSDKLLSIVTDQIKTSSLCYVQSQRYALAGYSLYFDDCIFEALYAKQENTKIIFCGYS